MGKRGDLRLLRMAIMQRWDTSELRDLMVAGLPMDLQSESPRVRGAARKCVIAMESQNQKDEHNKAIVELQRIHNELADILNPPIDGTIEGNSSARQAVICEGVEQDREGSEETA